MADTRLTRESRIRLKRKKRVARDQDMQQQCCMDLDCPCYEGFSGDSLIKY